MSRRNFLKMAGAVCGGVASGILNSTAMQKELEAQSQSYRILGPDGSPSVLTPMHGQVLHFRSRIYGDAQAFALCVSDLSPDPKPLLVELKPRTYSRMDDAAQQCQRICRIARDAGLACAVLRPGGRGDGSLYQGYGEVDVLEAIEAVKSAVAIDTNRIGVMGASMGGAATWYHASHYPDFWSGAVPMAAYCDYKLWEKPGGSTFPLQAWEEFSWLSRDAAYRPGNLRNVALRILHGEWDRAVEGGVPVEHSRQMDRKLTALGIPHDYVEVPKTGHSVARNDVNYRDAVVWLLKQKRVENPEQITLTVHTLRHNKSHWVTVEQQIMSGMPSAVEAAVSGGQLKVTTSNVRRLALGPLAGSPEVEIKLDGATFPRARLLNPVRFAKTQSGTWIRDEDPIPHREKRRGVSGPFGDLFIEPALLVYGTSGTDAETHFNQVMANEGLRFFHRTNGGIHRGGIPGENSVPLPVLSDQQLLQLSSGDASPLKLPEQNLTLDKDLAERANLFLIGNAKSNNALARLARNLPVAFSNGRIDLAGKTYQGEHLACLAILPHPDGKRYVGLLAGNEPDAICWGSHLGWQLLPDYLVFNHAEVVEWGFWNHHWRHTAAGS
jgi:predicted esterase